MKTIYLFHSLILLTCTLLINNLSAQQRTFEKTFGGSSYDFGHSIACTDDGGYVVTGLTGSYGDTLGDTYVLKLDSLGNQQWNKITGGDHLEGGNAIVPIPTGGYYIMNHTESFGAGDCDGWVYRSDKKGNIMWQTTYGGVYDEVARDGILNSDGNLIVAGLSEMAEKAGDGYIAKYNSDNGDPMWIHTYGGIGREQVQRILQTTDGGYIAAGESDVDANGIEDIWVFKTDVEGNLQWSKKIGGPGYEEGYGLCIAPDGGYIVTGFTTSYGAGDEDAFLFKLDQSGNLLWSKNYGGQLKERAKSVTNTPDGGFMITGFTESFGDTKGDLMIIKTDQYGNQLWMKTYGGTETDEGSWIVKCPKGGYAVCGYTKSKGDGKEDIYVLRINEEGNIATKTTEVNSTSFDLKVYPIPAKDYVIIKTGNIDIPKKSSLTIYDVLGNKVYEYSPSGINDSKFIDLSKWLNGTYIYNFKCNNVLLNEGRFSVSH